VPLQNYVLGPRKRVIETMKTDDLIKMLSCDDAHMAPLPDVRVAVAGNVLILMFVLTILHVYTGMGIRTNYIIAMSSWLVCLKQILPATMAFSLLPFLCKLSSPQSIARPASWRYLILILPMIILFITSLSGLDGVLLMAAMQGETLLKCLIVVPTLSILGSYIIISALKHGAPSYPVQSGFWVGVTSGAFVCIFYAFSCTEDSPLFYAIWYSVGIGISGIFGAVIGHFKLRW